MDAQKEGRIFGLGGIALGLFGIAAPYTWPKMPPYISSICLILAGFCGIIALCLIIPKKYIIIITSPARRINKMWLIGGMVIGGGIFVYCAIAYFSNLSTEPTTNQPTAEEIASEIIKKLPTEIAKPISQLDQPTFQERVEKVTIEIGTGQAIFDINILRKQKVNILNFGGYYPITVYVEGNKIYADVIIYGASGKPPIEIIHHCCPVEIT